MYSMKPAPDTLLGLGPAYCWQTEARYTLPVRTGRLNGPFERVVCTVNRPAVEYFSFLKFTYL